MILDRYPLRVIFLLAGCVLAVTGFLAVWPEVSSWLFGRSTSPLPGVAGLLTYFAYRVYSEVKAGPRSDDIHII